MQQRKQQKQHQTTVAASGAAVVGSTTATCSTTVATEKITLSDFGNLPIIMRKLLLLIDNEIATTI